MVGRQPRGVRASRGLTPPACYTGGAVSSSSSSSPMLDIPTVLAPIQDDVAVVGERFKSILADVSMHTRDMVDQVGSFTGKRLRPALTIVAARIAGAGVTPDVATVAAVVELIHTATLVHDDILDGASVRRRVATLNARWGEQTAVLAGDVLFSKAYRAAAYLDDPFASRYLSDCVGEVLEGEIHQDLAARNPDLSDEEYRQIIRGKTAALYEGALRVGAHYGGAEPDLTEALGRYGHHLGMAFQIVDDRLDVAGDERRVGKTLGTDLSEGKTTLPVIFWLRSLPEGDRAEAHARLERAWDDAETGQAVARAIAESGVIDQVDAAAREELRLAREAIADVPAGVERTLLEQIADYVLRRTR